MATAESTVVKTHRDGQVTIAGSSKTYQVAYEKGDFQAKIEKAARTVVRSRGAIVGVRKGDDPVLTGSFSIYAREFENTSSDSFVDVVEGANTWVGQTTGGTGYEGEFRTLTFKERGATLSLGDAADGTLVFAKCILTWDFAEGDLDEIKVSWECYGGMTRTGTP